jgi:hypothetical protein
VAYVDSYRTVIGDGMPNMDQLTPEQSTTLNTHFAEGRQPIAVAILMKIPAPAGIAAWRVWNILK